MDEFSIDKLDVYRATLEFCRLARSALPPRGDRELREQLIRASTSILLNIAEGAGRKLPEDKRRFYQIARGSAMECASILDLLRAVGVGNVAINTEARSTLHRVVQMLSRMI